MKIIDQCSFKELHYSQTTCTRHSTQQTSVKRYMYIQKDYQPVIWTKQSIIQKNIENTWKGAGKDRDFNTQKQQEEILHPRKRHTFPKKYAKQIEYSHLTLESYSSLTSCDIFPKTTSVRFVSFFPTGASSLSSIHFLC